MKRILPLLLVLFIWLPAQAVEVTVTTDLQADARLAAERRVPLMLVVSADYCQFCKLLAEEFLKPMLLSGDYTDKVVIRELRIDSNGRVRDFDGEMTDADTLAYRHRASLTPTLLFFDSTGQQIVPRIVGVGTLEFFGGEIDRAIETGLQRIRGR